MPELEDLFEFQVRDLVAACCRGADALARIRYGEDESGDEAVVEAAHQAMKACHLGFLLDGPRYEDDEHYDTLRQFGGFGPNEFDETYRESIEYLTEKGIAVVGDPPERKER